MHSRRSSILIAVFALLAAFSLTAQAVEIVSVSLTPEAEAGKNYAPIAENLSFTTFRGVAVHGEFAAVDPEGDMISFRVSEQPRKGSVEVSGSGFVYTPEEGKKGRDSFTYIAIDSAGHLSEEATVQISIEKQGIKLTYADMDGHSAHYAALRLAEEGIYIGEQLGSEYFFAPDDTLSRGEFLTLCLNTVGLEPLSGISRTGFSDDGSIPAWEKAYVSAGLMAGVVQGYSTDTGEIVFASRDSISCAEAMVMLNNALRISDVSASAALFPEAAPAWAAQAAANLSACSIISPASAGYDKAITRGEAALMLSSSLDLIAERSEGGSSLLSKAW